LKMRALLATVTALAISAGVHALAKSADDLNLQRSDIMSGLQSPWDMAFTQDGTMFFTEKCRGLSVRLPNSQVVRLFGTGGSAMVASDLFCESQSGMNGVALDPDFTQNRSVFVYMASTAGGEKNNRVVRLDLNESLSAVTDRTDIVTGISYKQRRMKVGGPGAHSGGRLRFGPDKFLYIPTGDNHEGVLPQDLTRLGGKVLRVDRDGKAAPGNKTPNGGDARIFTYGHRNIQGLDFHPETGQAFVAEHGPGHSDEVTALVAGGNGGWDPTPEKGVDCPDGYCGYTSNKPDGTLTPMTDLTKFPDAMKPVYVYKDSAGIAPLVFLRGSRWQAVSGDPVVGFLRAQRVDVLKLNEKGAVENVTSFDLPRRRVRALVQGPDERLYIATDEGNIWAVEPGT
jgi:glucose/arabinose dehydrogenase